MRRRILLISDTTEGGAAIGCRRLREVLRRLHDLDVRWTAAMGSSNSDVTIASRDWPSLVSLFQYRLKKRLYRSVQGLRRAENDLNESSVLRVVRRIDPDLVYLQNLHQSMSFRLVEKLPQGIPLFWTLRDMWALTGYCCYSYECDKYLTGCRGQCPQTGLWGCALNSPEEEWRRRQVFFMANSERLVITTPSRWLSSCAKARFGNVVRVECIPNTVETEVFRPAKEKRGVREALDLPTDRNIILAGSQFIDDERKGTSYLIEAVRILEARHSLKPYLVIFGESSGKNLPGNIISVGRVRDMALLNLYYNAADVFVLPSLADNLPNTLLEAVSAGTPCVTFNVGGCAEVVRDGETGFVAKYKDTDDLARCIERVLTMPEARRAEMSGKCRETAVKEYSMEIQAKRYEKVFGEVMEERDET